jgi:translation elongation factor EF-1beta
MDSNIGLPVLKQLNIALKEYGPEINDIISRIAFGIADIKIAVIKRYMEAGFSKEESIQLAVQQIADMKDFQVKIAEKLK